MDNRQKEKILRLRMAGSSYTEIANAVKVPIGTIKAFCSRNSVIKNPVITNAFCQNCGELLAQKQKQKPSRFCSDNCRMAWWGNNRDRRKLKGDQHICIFCRKEYQSYDKESKYCSRSCFVSDRFKKNGKLHDT